MNYIIIFRCHASFNELLTGPDEWIDEYTDIKDFKNYKCHYK